MCSNTSHSSGGDINDGYGCDSIYSKKAKRARMPKRGPGVAELEKILREQETKIDHLSDVNTITTTTIDHGFSLDPSSISLSNSYHSSSPHSPPPPPPPILKPSSNSTNFPKNTSFPPDPNPFTTRMRIFASNSNSSTNNPAFGGNCAQISGSAAGLDLPHHIHLPTMWDHYQQQQQQKKKQQEEAIVDVGAHRLYHPSPNFQNFMQKNQYSPPSMINLFPHSAMPSSTIPQAPSAVRSRCKEPPSSQNSCHHSHYLWPDEDKTTSVVGTKRSRPVVMEMLPIPQFRYDVPTFSTSTPLDSSFSSSYGSHNNVINLEPTDSMSREMKMGRVLKLEPNLRKCSTDYCPDSNFLLFGPSAIPSPPTTHHLSQRERPSFCSNFPFQESMEETQFRPAAAAEGVSMHKKPFYSFLLPMEQMSKVDTSFSLNNGRTETRGDGIDLSLRL